MLFVESSAKHRRSSQAGLGLVAVGSGVALISVPIICVWFLMRTGDVGAPIDPALLAKSKAASAIVVAAKPAEPTFQLAATQSTRVELADPPKPAPAPANAVVASLDITGSIGAPAASFSKTPPGQLDYRFSNTAPSNPAAPKPTAAATQDTPRSAAPVARHQASVPAPVPRQAERVQTASLATPTPSTLRAPPSPSPVLDQKIARNKVLTNAAVLRMFEKIRGRPQEEQLALGYAPTESGLFSDSNSFTPAVTGPIDQYTAVYDAHLPLRSRAVWALLEGLISGVAVPLIAGRGL